MSTTKPDTDTGWSKEFPTVDGDYLCRINEHDLSPVSFRFENGAIYEYGCGKNLRSDYHHYGAKYEFLGPLTWRDFEQLIRLRSVALNALIWMEWWRDPTTTAYPDGLPPMSEIIAALREALAHTGEQS